MGSIYIQTGKVKEVSKQIQANPKVEICAFGDGKWVRIPGKLIRDDRIEAKKHMLDNYPSLQTMYSAEVEAESIFAGGQKPSVDDLYFNNVILKRGISHLRCPFGS